MIALRNLRHENIVGYTTVWCEYPPKDWQEEQEKIFQVPTSPEDSTIFSSTSRSVTTQSSFNQESTSGTFNPFCSSKESTSSNLSNSENDEAQESCDASSAQNKNDSEEKVNFYQYFETFCHAIDICAIDIIIHCFFK